MTENHLLATRPERSRVALVHCDSYDLSTVRRALDRALELVGGVDGYISRDERILLKPNLLSAHRPEENVTTHPNLVRAVAQICLEVGAKVIIGDSSSRDPYKTVYQRTGMASLSDVLDVSLVSFGEEVQVGFPNGHQNRQFILARPVLEADGIINLPKLKTHHLTRITATVKNLFGCVPGVHKPEFHVRLPGVHEFARMLVDLNLFLRPRLNIVDAVMAMEGNGPSSGDAYPLKLIAVSNDPVALDSVICRLINLPPELVLTNVYGQDYGLGWMDAEQIELVGDACEQFFAPRFKVERGPEMPYNLAWRYRFLKNWISNRPVIDPVLCRRCGQCIDQCPVEPKALAWGEAGDQRPPHYDYSQCIRCYCCQEICPYRAIKVQAPPLRHALDWIYQNIWMRL